MSIGKTLLAARESAGLSVDEVASKTKIRGQLIRQIERDDFSSCGGAIYARGHIRNIAVAVGVDPAPLVTEFDREQRSHAAPDMHHPLEHEELVGAPGNGPNWTAAMFVAAVVLLVVALVMVFNNGGPPLDPVTAAPNVSSPTPAAKPKPTKAPKPKPTEAPVALTGVNVRITVTGAKSWITVRDGRTKAVLFQEVMTKGQVKDFKAPHKLSLVIGDAGAVRLLVNGRNLGAPGGPGDVVRVSFGPGDPAAG